MERKAYQLFYEDVSNTHPTLPWGPDAQGIQNCRPHWEAWWRCSMYSTLLW